MKNWFLFGTGFTLGILAGAFLASFLLFDDMVATPPPLRQSQTFVKKPSPTARKALTAKLPEVSPSLTVSSPPQPMDRPVAVTAQPVDLATLPPAEDITVVATAPSEMPNVGSAP